MKTVELLTSDLKFEGRISELALNLPVEGIETDSRKPIVAKIFVAISGTQVDGHSFIEKVAISRPALIVGELPLGSLSSLAQSALTEHAISYIWVTDSKLALALLSSGFFDHPSRKLKMIGITGTSGKTTMTYLVESILKSAGFRPGVIGTVNVRFLDQIIESTHTTPGAFELQGILRQMLDAGCDSVVMEVSSHGLKLHRTASIAFDVVAFTNLSPEHLDFHPDLDDYFNSKALLFRNYPREARRVGKNARAVVSIEESRGQALFEELKAGSENLVMSVARTKPADFSGHGLKVSVSGIQGRVGEVSIDSPLVGDFNAENLLLAVAIGEALGISGALISKGLNALKIVEGRLEKVVIEVQGEAQCDLRKIPDVWVDYAHKSDALEKVLKTFKQMKGSRRLVCVFGCGGDRDKQKRPVMAKIAQALSDRVIITSDNPRTEDPHSIISEILSGVDNEIKNVEVIPDRAQAIDVAISTAHRDDLIVIAGKGHENYQLLPDPTNAKGVIKIHFDDREEAIRALKKLT